MGVSAEKVIVVVSGPLCEKVMTVVCDVVTIVVTVDFAAVAAAVGSAASARGADALHPRPRGLRVVLFWPANGMWTADVLVSSDVGGSDLAHIRDAA